MVFDYCKACKQRVDKCLIPDSHRAQTYHVWCVDFLLGGARGKRIRKQFKSGVTKKEAEKFEHITVADFERGTFIPTDKSKTATSEVIDRYFNDHLFKVGRSPKTTLEYYQRTLKKLIGHIGIGLVTLEVLQDIRSQFQAESKSSNSNVNRLFSIVKTVLNRAVEWGYIPRNPAQFLRRLKTDPTVPRFLTHEELLRLWSALRDARARDFATILLHSAIRPIDIKTLDWSQVDLVNQVIHITTHKGRSPRSYVVPISGVVLPILERRYRETKGLGLVFNSSNLRKLCDKAIDVSGINVGRTKKQKFTIYGLKHTYISNLLMSGAGVSDVSKLTGVSVPTLMKHYVKFTLEHLRAVQAKVQFDLPVQAQLEVV